jgi:SAM-dependent methyltransferase
LLDTTEPQQRPYVELALCVHRGVQPVLDRTGLSPASPPEHIHAMGRGPLAAGGSYYYADLVAEGLRLAGGDPLQCRRALDFGCSSGRVVRVLAAAYQDTEWHGCDPNEPAIRWAREHLSGIAFEVSGNDPPLSYPSDHFDLVFAISIWSHLSETSAAAWLEEMERMVRRGGHLLLTAQGYQSLAHFARSRSMSDQDLARARAGLYRRAFWFEGDWFWRGGDHGIRSADWGMTFLTPEWILMNAPPAWALVGFRVGRSEGNQDLYVLQRR